MYKLSLNNPEKTSRGINDHQVFQNLSIIPTSETQKELLEQDTNSLEMGKE